MKRKIISYISLILLISSSVLVLIFSTIITKQERTKEAYLMDTILEQTNEALIRNEELLEEAKQLFIEDYENRAKFIKYLLEEKNGTLLQGELIDNKIHDAIDVKHIHIVDINGNIVQTTDKDIINENINFYKSEELAPYIEIIESKETGKIFVDFNRKTVVSQEQRVFLAYSVNIGDIKMIELEIEPKALERYISQADFKLYINNIPTTWSTTIFIIYNDGTKDGKLVAITENNPHQVEIVNRIETLEKAIDNTIEVEINGIKQMLLVKNYAENYYLGYCYDISVLTKTSYGYLGTFAITILFLTITIIVVLFFFINNHILRDINMITNSIYNFVHGGKSVKFKKAKTKEMNELVLELKNVIDVILIKRDSLSYVTKFMGDRFEAYEYYPEINQIYYSDNMLKLCELERSDFEHQIRKQYRDNVKNILDQTYQNESIVETKSGRFLKIQCTFTMSSSFAIVEDITDINNEKKELQNKLDREINENYLDVLTGLYNRKKIKEVITNKLNNNQMGELVLLLDLDNFKKINDSLGHIKGDKVLLEFTNLLNNHFSNDCIKSRIGGDEFVILVPFVLTKAQIENKLSTFIKSFHEVLAEYYDKFKLSVSVGAICINNDMHTFEDVYQAVDSAMYVAKNHGKDRFYFDEL